MELFGRESLKISPTVTIQVALCRTSDIIYDTMAHINALLIVCCPGMQPLIFYLLWSCTEFDTINGGLLAIGRFLSYEERDPASHVLQARMSC